MDKCNCALCGEYLSKENVVCEYKHTFLMFNRYPYLVGHLMLVPKRPVATLSELTPEERIETFDKIIEAQYILLRALADFGVTSTNVGINTGPHSGGSIQTHVHVHIVPRRLNDTNFLHTCINSGDLEGIGSARNPTMFCGMYENARKKILVVAQQIE